MPRPLELTNPQVNTVCNKCLLKATSPCCSEAQAAVARIHAYAPPSSKNLNQKCYLFKDIYFILFVAFVGNMDHLMPSTFSEHGGHVRKQFLICCATPGPRNMQQRGSLASRYLRLPCFRHYSTAYQILKIMPSNTEAYRWPTKIDRFQKICMKIILHTKVICNCCGPVETHAQCTYPDSGCTLIVICDCYFQNIGQPRVDSSGCLFCSQLSLNRRTH
jgi:hypothetical protein